MDKVSIIADVLKLLPNNILYGSIMYRNESYVVKDFISTVFADSLKEGATVPEIMKFINTHIIDKITPNKKVEIVDNFFSSLPAFQESVRISEDEYMNVREYFYEKIIPFMVDENKVRLGSRVVTLSDVYTKVLDNAYTEPTIVDYAEVCASFTENMDSEVKNAEYEGVTFGEYVENVLPTMMTSVSTIKVNGVTIDILTFVTSLVENLSKKIEEEKQARLDRTNENPSLLTEIAIANNLNNDSKQVLSNEESASLMRHLDYVKNDFLSPDKRLNSISSATDKCKTEAALNKLLAELDKITDEKYITTKSILKRRIEEKRRSIIKTKNNKDDLIASSKKYIEYLKTRINSATTLDECSTIFGLIVTFENRIIELDINDRAMNYELASLKEYHSYKAQTIRDNRENYKNVSEINEKIDKEFEILKKTIDYLDETDGVFYDPIVRSLNYKLEDLKGTIMDATSNNLITSLDSAKYEAMLSEVTNELESKNNLGSKVII